MSLTRLAISRPVTILMLVLTLVIMGLKSYDRLPVDLYPNVEFPMIFISTVYPGTGPEEMETLVSKPIEDQLSTISGLNKISSTSSEGVSQVQLEFKIGTDLNEVSADVRSKLDALRNGLPEDAQAPVVIKADIGAMPVITLNMSSSRRSSIEVRRLADDVLKDRLSQVPGVATVSVSGGDVREIQVEVDKSRLEAYGIGINQVISALQAENLNLPSGSIEEKHRDYAVRVMGEFATPEQINGVHLSNAAGDTNLTIGDVATVRDTIANPDRYTRMNGGSSVSLTVQKQSDGNTVKVVDGVREALEKMTGQPFTEAHVKAAEMAKKKGETYVVPGTTPILPSDIGFTATFDQSIFIKDALHDVNESLIVGALLAILIVFLFLHSLRGTFIVALAIPTSMIATYMIMDMLGFSVNMLSMMGLSLSVGILVDDSIVVIENIHRHLKMGKSPREAAIAGRSEIGLAAMTITLVDVVVFVPIAFMGGIMGQFFRQFGIVVATATLFSLFISFTLTPMLASRWLKSHAEEEEEEERQHEHPGLFRRFVTAWERWYSSIESLYRRILAWSLDHHSVAICLGLMIFSGSIATVMPKANIWAPGGLGQMMTTLGYALPLFLIGMAVIAGLWALEWMAQRHNRFGALALVLRVLFGIIGEGIVVAILTFMASKGIIPPAAAIVIGIILTAANIAHPAVSFFLISIAVAIASTSIGTAAHLLLQTEVSLIIMLMLIATFAIMGYTLWLPTDRKVTETKSASKPLTYMALALYAFIIIVPTTFTFEFFPRVDQRQFSIKIEQAVGTPLDITDATTRKIEAALHNPKVYPEVKSTTVMVGGTSNMMGAGSSAADTAQVNVELKDMARGLRTTDEVISAINTQFALLPGVKVSAAVASNGPGGTPVSIQVSGPDMAKTQQVAGKIEEIVRKTEGTFGTELSWRSGRPELQAHIDRDRAAQYGLSVAQIASALRASMEGDTSSKYREDGKEYNIRVSLPDDQRDVIGQVPAMVVGSTPTGRPVYLYEVVKMEPAGGPTKIERTERLRSVTVSAQLGQGYAIGNVQQVIDAKIKEAHLETADVNIKWSGQAEEMKESFGDMTSALLLSVILVFILMAALFESLLSPLIIWMSVPLAMGGAILALSTTHKSLSMMSMIGIIMLVGLVTKNAILMVDYTNTLRREHGLDRRRALLQAGPTRLRPILMTTLAMIFGMAPTAIALTKGAEMRQPMAITVIGGLLLGMFLTLLMVPTFYEILDGLGERFAKAKTKITEKAGV